MGLEEKLPSGILLTSVEKLVNWTRKASLFPATFGLACCAIEMMTTGAPRYDLGRFGMEVFRASPRQADLMIVAGRVSARRWRRCCGRSTTRWPSPSGCSSMGVCASSGGMFNNYAIVQGVDHIVPVDMYLPGCPPRPEMLIDAILKLHAKIMDEPLGPEAGRRAAGQAHRTGRVLGPVRQAAGADRHARGQHRPLTSSTPDVPRQPAGRAARTATKDQPAASGGVPTVVTGGNDAAEGGPPRPAATARSTPRARSRPAPPTTPPRRAASRRAVAERAPARPPDRRCAAGAARPVSSGPACSACTAPATPPATALLVRRAVHAGARRAALRRLLRRGRGRAARRRWRERSIPPQALLQTTVANQEITFYVARDLPHRDALGAAGRPVAAVRAAVVDLRRRLRRQGVPRRLHVVYELTSMTYRRRIRLEVAVDVDDAARAERRRRVPDRRLARAGDLGHVRDRFLRSSRR